MFAVHGKYWGTIFQGYACYYFSCHNECFLVCKGECFTCFECFDGGAQSCKPYHGSQYHVDFGRLNYVAKCFVSGINFYGQVAEGVSHLKVFVLGGNDNAVGEEFTRLLDE